MAMSAEGPPAPPVAPEPVMKEALPPPPAPAPAVDAKRQAPQAGVSADCVVARPIKPEDIPEPEKKAAREAIAGYFEAIAPTEPSAEQAERIGKLIGEFGSDEWTARENAVKALAAIGRPALGALHSALKSKDAEVASRAAEAVKAIEASALKPLSETFAKSPMAVYAVVWDEMIPETRTAWSKTRAEIQAARKSGHDEQARELAARETELAARISKLNELYLQLAPGSRYQLER